MTFGFPPEFVSKVVKGAYDAGYKKGMDDALALRDDELRQMVAEAMAQPLPQVAATVTS